MSLPVLAAEETSVVLSAGERGPYTVTERTDLSRYDNDKYTGHLYREVRSHIRPDAALTGKALGYSGTFYVLEETLRDMRKSARGVDQVVEASFTINPRGETLVNPDRGFPSLRGFPAFPAGAIRKGSRWTSAGSRAVDPLNEGKPVVVPLLAEYEYRGEEQYQGINVHRISARYASRFDSRNSGDSFSHLEGTHAVDILVRVGDCMPLLIRDNLDETYMMRSGLKLRFRGFTLIFGQGASPMNRGDLIQVIGDTLGGIAQGDGKPKPPAAPPTKPGAPPAPPKTTPDTPQPPDKHNAPPPPVAPPDVVPPEVVPPPPVAPLLTRENIDLSPVPEGVKLTVRDIRFEPDSPEFLPAEMPRLDLIAQALKAIPDRNFLVEGHTARVGDPSNEVELSLRRAKHMVDEMVKRGIPAERFIYKGWGGSRPIADNNSEEGRARNRRVEITILQ